MWIANIAKRLFSEWNLRNDCFDEIVAAVKKKGIKFTKIYISYEKIEDESGSWVGHQSEMYKRHKPRRVLEDLKRKGAPYSIEVVLHEPKAQVSSVNLELYLTGETDMPVLNDIINTYGDDFYGSHPPNDFTRIGETTNPNYNQELNYLKKEIDKITACLKTDKEGLENTSEAGEKVREAIKEWTDIPMDEWQKRSGACPNCKGEGSFTDEYDATTSSCNVCCGKGGLNATETKRYHYNTSIVSLIVSFMQKEIFPNRKDLFCPSKNRYVWIKVKSQNN